LTKRHEKILDFFSVLSPSLVSKRNKTRHETHWPSNRLQKCKQAPDEGISHCQQGGGRVRKG
jgi:hypothetical protein